MKLTKVKEIIITVNNKDNSLCNDTTNSIKTYCQFYDLSWRGETCLLYNTKLELEERCEKCIKEFNKD